MSDLRVVLVGDDGTAERAVRAADGDVVDDRDAASLPPDGTWVEASSDTAWPAKPVDAVVAVGERALCRAALADPPAPLLGVDVPAARHAVSATSLRDALAALAAGEATTASHALLSVSVDGDHVGRAALDAGLVTSEPARISEYSIRGASGLTESFRADGVVVATPLGSAGYGRAAGGPVLAPGTGLAVTPVAPFATAADSWVLGDRVTLRVERDEGDVSLLVDDRAVQVVPSGTPVRITTDGTVDVVCASGYETGR